VKTPRTTISAFIKIVFGVMTRIWMAWRRGEPVSRHVDPCDVPEKNSQDDHGRHVEQDAGNCRLKTFLGSHHMLSCEKTPGALIICYTGETDGQLRQQNHRRDFCRKAQWWQPEAPQSTARPLSLRRIAGANDRISLGHIGVGNRGSRLDGIVARLKDQKNV